MTWGTDERQPVEGARVVLPYTTARQPARALLWGDRALRLVADAELRHGLAVVVPNFPTVAPERFDPATSQPMPEHRAEAWVVLYPWAGGPGARHLVAGELSVAVREWLAEQGVLAGVERMAARLRRVPSAKLEALARRALAARSRPAAPPPTLLDLALVELRKLTSGIGRFFRWSAAGAFAIGLVWALRR